MNVEIKTDPGTSEFDYVGFWNHETPLSEEKAEKLIIENFPVKTEYPIKSVSIFCSDGRENKGDDLSEGSFYATTG